LFQPQSAAHLASVLDAAWKGVREEGTVPGIAPSALPHDMEHLDLETRKRTFLRSLAPHLLAVNKEIAADRRQLLAIARQLRHGAALPEGSVAFLGAACCRYGVPEAQERLAAGRAGAAVAHLLVHVDEVPLRLALAQAAVESAWGASRLAKEDKSLFGLSVEKAGKRPSARPGPGGLWYARYATLRDGVEAYVRNLNRFWAYEEFRKVRASMRRKGVPLSSLRLAGGLSPYSELGERYVAKVRAVIQGKEFTVFSQVRLAPLSPRPAVEAPGQMVPALALDRLHSVAGGNQGT
jgi:Bax protein